MPKDSKKPVKKTNPFMLGGLLGGAARALSGKGAAAGAGRVRGSQEQATESASTEIPEHKIRKN